MTELKAEHPEITEEMLLGIGLGLYSELIS